MPTNLKQPRALVGGISYYRNFLENQSTLLRLITALLEQGAKLLFTPGHGSHSPPSPPRIRRPSDLGLPRLERRRRELPPLPLHCDASRDGFGATLEQQQPGGSVSPILFISHANLDSERSWTPL